MSIAINPGSGPVEEATLENAQKNIEQFMLDLKDGLFRDDRPPIIGMACEREPKHDEGGRFCFRLIGSSGDGLNQFTNEIDMPGLPLDQVRFLGEPDQDIWDFPRLYVDGSSWVWKYALHSAGYWDEDE